MIGVLYQDYYIATIISNYGLGFFSGGGYNPSTVRMLQASYLTQTHGRYS